MSQAACGLLKVSVEISASPWLLANRSLRRLNGCILAFVSRKRRGKQMMCSFRQSEYARHSR